ncbi:MAG: TonB-dependent receptor plug domain-containing protein, partial [Rhodothalassiaceae bacterium]
MIGKDRKRNVRQRGFALGVWLLAILLPAIAAQAAEEREFDIPAQPLSQSLIDFSVASGFSVLVADELVAGRTAPALRGRYAPLDALEGLLAGSGLVAERVDARTVSIHAPEARQEAGGRQEASLRGLQPGRVPPPRPEPPAITVEEITVTARRRAESALDVPIALTAFSGEKLAEYGTVDITGLNDLVPNVTFEVSRNTNTTLTPFIRGVGQQDPVAGFEQGVGVYIDDVYLNRPQGAVLDIYDIERIEVLRGPQGTLYGRNTIGGAVKYVTRRIADEPELELKLSGGSFRQIDAVATFSLPLGRDLRMGGTVGSFQRDGFGDNLTLGIENASKDILAGRLSF